MLQFCKQNWGILLILLVSLAPFFWFTNQYFIYGPDTIWSLNAPKDLYTSLYLWKDNPGLGYGWADQGTLFHNISVVALLNLGIPYPIVQKIIISFLMFISGLGMYLLFRSVTHKKHSNKIIALLAAIFYIVNPFALTWIWWRFLWVIYIYAVLPYLFLFLTETYKQRLGNKKIAMFAIFVSLFSPGISAILMSVVASLGLLIFFITIQLLSFDKQRLINQTKDILFFCLVFISLSLWWLIPGVLMLNHSISNALTAYDPYEAFGNVSKYSNILNTIKLWGYHAIYLDYYGESYYGTIISTIRNNTFFNLVLLLPFLFIFPLFFELKKLSKDSSAKFLLGFSILLILGIFLMKGYNPPFSFLNYNLVGIPFGAAFRIPYDKFGYFFAIAISVLFPASILISKNQYFKPFAFISSVILLLVFIFIIFNPNFLPRNNDALSGLLVKVPDNYLSLTKENFSESDSILVLPPSFNQESAYKWEQGIQPNGHDIISSYTDSSIIFLPNGNFFNDAVRDFIDNNIFTNLYTDRDRSLALGFFDINQILLHKDWNKSFMQEKTPSPDFYESSLKSNIYQLTDVNSNFNIYKVQQKDQNSTIFATQNIFQTNGDALKTAAALSAFQNQYVVAEQNISTQFKPFAFDLSQPTISQDEITYNFTAPNNLNANFFTQKNIFDKFVGKPKIFLDGNPLSESDLYFKKFLFLAKGSHTIQIKSPDTSLPHLVNASFEKPNLLQGADWECTPRYSENITQVVGGTDGKYSINLKARTGLPTCVMSPINNLTPNNNLIISFSYKTQGSGKARILLIEDSTITKNSSNILINQRLTSTNEWTKADIYFYIQPNKNYRILFYADGDTGSTQYDDFRSVQVPVGFNDLMYLYQDSTSYAEKTDISYQKLNPSLYFANLHASGTLAISLNKSYDPYWRAYLQKNNPPHSILEHIERLMGFWDEYQIPDINHVAGNGYLNTWILNSSTYPPGYENSSSIIIEYWPQRLYYLGLLLSFSALCLVILFILKRQYEF
jgi:hypothetical protein